MIEFAIAAIGSALMAFEDIRTNGYGTFEPIAVGILAIGLGKTFYLQDTNAFTIIILTGIVATALYLKDYWGSSDSILATGIVALLPFKAAIFFPFALLVGANFIILPYFYQKIKDKEPMDVKGELPFLPAFTIAVILLWAIV